MNSIRQLKEETRHLLLSEDFDAGLSKILSFPLRKVINCLFANLHSTNERLKWRTVRAMGAVINAMASENMEDARNIMRRLMWNLNDESGGIGWGSPEAMGEIMACNEAIAGEYAHILISYIRPDGNFIEHDLLQRGLLWGIGRLAHSRPEIVPDISDCLEPFLLSSDETLRGLAAWAAGAAPAEPLIPVLRRLAEDDALLTIFMEGEPAQVTVGDIAKDALK